MLRLILSFLLILMLSQAAVGQSYGLQFSSHEVVAERRTSLNLTPAEPLCLAKDPELEFDMVFTPNLQIYFGYVMRIISTERQNIDIVYNQKLRNFNFVIGDGFSCTFQIDSAKLYSDWTNFSIRISGS